MCGDVRFSGTPFNVCIHTTILLDTVVVALALLRANLPNQYSQGWARDVKVRNRDETETLTSRDRDVGFTSRDETETRRL